MADEAPKTDAPASAKKELEYKGYKFTVDTDLLDDVEAFEYIDRIENKGQTAGIVPLIKFLIGDEGYDRMKKFYSAKDAEENKDTADYKGRFRVTELVKVYEVIIANFDPKG